MAAPGVRATAQRLDERVAAVRGFNRFYTRQIGLLQDGYLDSPFSLTQVRMLYELAHERPMTATRLASRLGLDPGYISRTLRGFQERGLIDRTPSAQDARQNDISLTQPGREVIDQLERRSQAEVKRLLDRLSQPEQARLVAAMETIESMLGDRPATGSYLLRPPAAGDMGWVVQRHGALYAAEYGWDASFEALVAEIVARFIRSYDDRRERCWIAEIDGLNVGSVFCVKKSETVAQLRLLLVEPHARRMGIGRRLVDECLRFARATGYKRMMLWTNDVLLAARHIYEACGFRLVEEERHRSFGKDLVGQNWEIDLQP
jgi:DNA-binding MarR family transcriptional regulator/N-acetylglutamate synthase-like GNAT family acetyltransferase